MKFKQTARLMKEVKTITRMTNWDLGETLGIHGQFVHHMTAGMAGVPPKYWGKLSKLSGIPKKDFMTAHLNDYQARLEAHL